MGYCGNKICLDKQTNGQANAVGGQSENKTAFANIMLGGECLKKMQNVKC